jgi:4-hydroxybenzoyl-CoA thioesterase
MSERFVHIRDIVWGDADPAGIVYTPRYSHFALEAIEAWMLARLGTDWFRLQFQQGGSTPFVHMELDFRASLRPYDRLHTEVTLRRIGRTSLDFGVTGRKDDVAVCFTGRFVCVFVDTEGRPRPVPEELRPILNAELALAG